VQARHELEGTLQTESGRDDLAGLRTFVRAAAPDDPRHAVAAARARALQVRCDSVA
jgi:hypothetical protein